MNDTTTIVKKAISALEYDKIIENQHELPLYHEVTENVISYLHDNGASSFGDIIANVQGSDRRTLRLLDQLVHKGMLSFKDWTFSLAAPAAGTASDTLRRCDAGCKHCDGKIIPLDGIMQPILRKMEMIARRKPLPTFVFDQRPVNMETTVRRAGYLIWRGDIRGKRIALLGDDDLTSIAIGLTGLAKEIVVIEIDKRLTDFIRKVAKEEGLRIRVVKADLTKQTPKFLLHKFDVFMADPTPTRIPLTVFTNYGIKLLKKQPHSIGYLSFYTSAMRRTMEIQEALTEMRLIMTDVVPFFTQYAFVPETYSENDMLLLDRYAKGISKLSFYEHLVRVETTEETRPLKITFCMDDILGGATRRVLKNPEKDPTMRSGSNAEKRYLRTVMSTISSSSRVTRRAKRTSVAKRNAKRSPR